MTNLIQLGDFVSKKQIAVNTKSVKMLRKHKDGRVFLVKITVTNVDDKNFQNEIKYLKTINHENIIKYYCAMKNSLAKGLMITEYADCGTLYSFLYEKGVPMFLTNAFEYCGDKEYKDMFNVSYSNKLSWMLQCSKGASYLHELKPKIYHNDLKTRHLLLSNRFRTLKICDFSTATESCLSINPENYYSDLFMEKTEIYNFGIVIWETLIANQNQKNVLDINDSEVIKALIKLCCDDYPVNRPKMRTLVNILTGIYEQSLKTDDIVYSQTCKFADFQIKEHLGSGAFGDVFKAIWRTKHGYKDVAIKRIKNIDKRVVVEEKMQYMSLIKHENIVKLFGITKDLENKIYCVMECADGGSLHKFLHDKRYIDVSVYGKLNWMLQCAKGVDHLHGRTPKPILHRDLKSHNLLLFNNYQKLKICDFDTVKPLQTEMTYEIGTAGFMAPEVCDSTKTYEEKCDVYSFGILCWETMSRKKPFYHLENPEILAIIKLTCDKKRPPMEDIEINEKTEPIRAWIEKCWAQDPAERPSMNEMVIRLAIDPLSYRDYMIRSLPPITDNDFTKISTLESIPI